MYKVLTQKMISKPLNCGGGGSKKIYLRLNENGHDVSFQKGLRENISI